jgi:tyrosine-protein kinase Etk/Wzc
MSTHKIAFPRLFDGSAPKSMKQAWMNRMHLLRIFRIFLICSIISFLAAALFRALSPPSYQITSTFSIDPSAYNQSSALTISSSKTADDIQQKISAEVDLLTSRSNLLSVVQKFNLSVNYRKVGLLQNKDLYLESPVDFQRTRMGAKAAGHINLTIKNRGSFIIKPEKSKAQEYAFNTIYTDDLGSWQISKMSNIAKYIGSTIRIDIIDPEIAADELQSNLDVTASVKPTSTLKLSIVDPVLTRGNDILNALLITYLQNSETEKERLAQSQLHFIEAQLITLNQDLTSLSTELKGLSAGSINAQAQSAAANEYLWKVKENDRLLNKLNIQIAALNELKQQFQNQKPGAVDTVNSAVADPLLNAMARALYENEFSYKRLQQTHLPDDPEVTVSLLLLQRQKNALLSEINGRLSPMLQQQKKLIEANVRHARGILTLSPNEVEQINVKRKMQVIPNLYADLLRSRESAALNHATYLAFSKPMNSSLMVTESKRFSVVVLLIGFVIPLGFLVLREILSTGKKTAI